MFNINFKNKVVLISGGTSGIGLATAKIFSQLSAKVIITCKSQDSFNKFRANYKKELSDNFMLEKLDITNDISIERLINKVHCLDILINNASIVKGGIEYRIENFADVVNVNLMGLMRISHAMLPKLAISKGSIVNVTSTSAKLSLANSPSYSATKGGIKTLTESMAACWSQHDVRVNAVAPGWIKGRTMNTIKKDLKNFKDYKKRIPLGRIGSPEDVANTIIFLASDKAAYISGATIFVDGGYSIN